MVPPSAEALPWRLPRAAEVERYYAEDTDASLFEALLTWVTDNVELSSAALAVLLAAWILHTYIVDLCTDSPYVALTGPPEVGKSRATATCIHAARRGILTPTAREASLIRYAHDHRATIGLDTIDFMEQVQPIQDFFASRTKNDGTVTSRVTDYGKGAFVCQQHFTSYGATFVTSNRAISEDWLASRTLVIAAIRATREFLVPVDRDAALVLRERGTAFRARVLRLARTEQLPEPERIAEGRLGDLMSGLALALQLSSPSHLPVLKELATHFAAARKTEGGDSLEVELLRQCIEQFGTSAEPQISVKLQDLVRALNLERGPMGERPLSSRKVGAILRTTFQLALWSGTGNYTFITLQRGQLSDLATRYGLSGPGAAHSHEEVNVGEDGKHDESASDTPKPGPTVN